MRRFVSLATILFSAAVTGLGQSQETPAPVVQTTPAWTPTVQPTAPRGPTAIPMATPEPRLTLQDFRNYVEGMGFDSATGTMSTSELCLVGHDCPPGSGEHCCASVHDMWFAQRLYAVLWKLVYLLPKSCIPGSDGPLPSVKEPYLICSELFEIYHPNPSNGANTLCEEGQLGGSDRAVLLGADLREAVAMLTAYLDALTDADAAARLAQPWVQREMESLMVELLECTPIQVQLGGDFARLSGVAVHRSVMKHHLWKLRYTLSDWLSDFDGLAPAQKSRAFAKSAFPGLEPFCPKIRQLYEQSYEAPLKAWELDANQPPVDYRVDPIGYSDNTAISLRLLSLFFGLCYPLPCDPLEAPCAVLDSHHHIRWLGIDFFSDSGAKCPPTFHCLPDTFAVAPVFEEFVDALRQTPTPTPAVMPTPTPTPTPTVPAGGD